jgi:hypothetical protein
MQRKSIIAIILYIFIGNCALMAQNNSLLEIKLEDYNPFAIEEGFANNLIESSAIINQNKNLKR